MATDVQQRIHALDAVRAFALLLGIVLHATMSFFLPIPTRDSSQSDVLAGTFYVIHSFRMSLFFLIAGFFAHLAFHRSGARAFAKDRALRIAVPLAVGWILLAPPTLAILLQGVSLSNPEGSSAVADAAATAPQGFPLIHLWFLYNLCIFYVLALALRAVFVAWVDPAGALRARIDLLLAKGISSYLAPLILAAPLGVVLHFDPAWAVWFGLPTPDIGLAPQWPALVGFGSAFVLGWLVHRQTRLLEIWRRQWAVNLAVAAGLSALCMILVGVRPSLEHDTIDGAAWRRLLYAASYTVSIWYWVFGLIGAALRFCAQASAIRRYLADASYWLYLVHLPVVFGLQLLMANWALHWSVKFPLILTAAMGLLLPSYHFLVRPTVIGEVLNGRRYPRHRRTAETPVDLPAVRMKTSPDSDAQEPLVQLTGVGKRFGAAWVLDELNLSVRSGELLAVLGPNGAGKTTAISLMLGTLQPDAGSVRLMGGPPSDVHSRLDIGVMMQDVSLAPMLTAREHIALAASYYRDPLTVAQTVALTAIEAFADTRYNQLSGGQKRQVQFALAICGRPRLLFLDEPTVGLDVTAREALWRTVRTLLDQACAIVLTTHYLEEAEALADRVAVLANGKLIAQGSVEAIRALVTRSHIRCASTLDLDAIKRLPGVLDAERELRLVHVTASHAEPVVRRMLDADPDLSQLEIRPASLAQALAELTKEAA